ncbi:MAG: hypothetical protein ACLP8S_04870 [Solirubrobacteraceae bacterium]
MTGDGEQFSFLPGIVVLTGDGRIGGSHSFHDWWFALIVVGLV